MTNHGHRLKKKLSRIARDQRPRPLKYYLSSNKSYINLGRYATKAFMHAKDFLSKEIPLPSLTTSSVKSSEKVSVKMPGKNTANDKADVANDNDSLVIPDQEKVEHQSMIDEIKKITKRSNEVLCSATSVFPFSLFRDRVVLDRTKLTITKHDFFLSSQVMSIRIEDILNVSTDVGPFLGSINVAIRIMNSDDHISVNNLRRGDAIHLKHIIQGYVIAQHNKIDVAHLSTDELIETLTDLGHDLNI